VCSAQPDLFNHNIETVERIFKDVRPAGNYQRSLDVLSFVRRMYPEILVKSGCMVGLGETHDEVRELMQDLSQAGCDIVTIGQYLNPTGTDQCMPVDRFVTEAEFDRYASMAKEAGIRHVFAGPFIRSSYMAQDILHDIRSSVCAV